MHLLLISYSLNSVRLKKLFWVEIITASVYPDQRVLEKCHRTYTLCPKTPRQWFPLVVSSPQLIWPVRNRVHFIVAHGELASQRVSPIKCSELTPRPLNISILTTILTLYTKGSNVPYLTCFANFLGTHAVWQSSEMA